MRRSVLLVVVLALVLAIPPTVEAQRPAVVVVLPSALRGATFTASDDQQNVYGIGVVLHLTITAVAGTTPTLDIKVQMKNPVSGAYVDLPSASFAQKSAAGSDTLTIYPGLVETANRKVSNVIPDTWRLAVTIAGTATPTFTFSVAATYLP